MSEKLQIGIPCGPNSEKFTSFLIDSIEKTISGKYEHEYILGVNQRGVNFEQFKRYKNLKVVEEYAGLPHVLGHGQCLDLILRNMDSKYGIFVDSDVAFLENGWDDILISQLDEKCVVIGSEYHPTDGKVVDFPNVITFLFNTAKLKSTNITFVPKLARVVTTEESSSWYGVPPGRDVFLDTGCHIGENLHKHGFTWKTLKIVTPRYVDRFSMMKFMKNDMRGEEYQLEGTPICTHIGRSLTRSFSSDPIISVWKNRVEAWLNGKV